MWICKKWEVYRSVPESWSPWKRPGNYPYGTYWTRKRAETVAATSDATLRNGRNDTEFAAFKVRKR